MSLGQGARLPIALEFRRCVLMGKEVGEEGKGKGTGCSPEGEHACWVFCLESFLSFLQAEVLEEVSGKAFSRIIISSPGVPF